MPDPRPEASAEPPEPASEAPAEPAELGPEKAEQPAPEAPKLSSEATGESAVDPAPPPKPPTTPTKPAHVPSGEIPKSAISGAVITEEIQLNPEAAKKLSAAKVINGITYANGTFNVTVDGSVISIPGQNGILDLSSCVNLKTVCIINVPGLKGLKLPDACPNLKELSVSKCDTLSAINIPPLANSAKIEINNCNNLKELTLAKSNTGLEKLAIDQCGSIRSIDFSNVPILYMSVMSCASVNSLLLGANNRLYALELYDLPKLAMLGIGSCEKLGTLNVYGCALLREIDLSGCLAVNIINSNLETVKMTLPEGFSTVIDTADSSDAVKDALRAAGAILRGDPQATPTKPVPVHSGEGSKPEISDATKTEEIQLSTEDAEKLSEAKIIDKITYTEGVFSVDVDGSVIKIPGQNGILDLSSCVNLKTLTIENVPGLKDLKLPEACPNLTSLSISGCNNLSAINIPPLADSARIKIDNCSNLKGLTLAKDGIEINRLEINQCGSIKSIDLSNAPIACLAVICCGDINLISVNGNNQIYSLELYGLPKLAILDIGSCEKLKELAITNCASLKEINLSGCPSVSSVNSNSATVKMVFPNEFSTVVKANGSSREFKAILRKSGVTLEEDVALKNRGITVIADAEQATNLLNHAKTISDAKCVNGIFTAIVGGSHKIEIPIHNNTLDFSQCENLEEIHIENAPGIKAVILPINNNKLKVVDFKVCGNLEMLDLSGFANLTEINLSICHNLNELKLPPQCDNLKKLVVSCCHNLEKLDILGFTNLVGIQLISCYGLNELKLPSANNHLENLDIISCSKLVKLDISAYGNIREIYINECDALTEIMTGNNNNITMFTADLCGKLSHVDLSRCEHIEYVNVTGNTNIIAPNKPPSIIDAADSSEAVKQTLRDAGATLKGDTPAKPV
jgi:hypothetical protein